MRLNSDSFCDSVPTWMEVIGHLWAELGFWLFSGKRVKMSAAADIWKGADILTHFGKSCRYNKPCQYGRDAAHISWADLWADSTWGLHGGEATPSERDLQPDWEGDRVESLPSPNSKRLDADIFSRLHFRAPTSIVGRLHFSYCLIYCFILWDANMFDRAPTFHVGAYILWT